MNRETGNSPPASLIAAEPPRWIVFDLGGILVPENGQRIVAQMARVIGLPENRLADAMRKYTGETIRGERTLLQCYAAALQDIGLNLSPIDALERHLALYKELSTKHNPDVAALIRRLRTAHRLACLSNIEHEIAEICRQTGLLDYFDRAYLSVELGLMKPDMRIFQAVLADLACAPFQALFIDDREENVQGARQAGMNALRFWNAVRLEEDLKPFCPALRESVRRI